MKHKKILITGGAGFVGSNLAVKFKKNYSNLEITALDNLYRRGSELSLKRLKKYGVKFLYGDVRHKEDLKLKTDLIVECSAEPSFSAGIDGKTDYLIQTNLQGAVNCFDLAKENKADIIFMSTSRVYPVDLLNKINFLKEKTRFTLKNNQSILGISSRGINEDFPLNGVRSLYGATKLAAELILAEYIDAYDIRGVINRFGTISGPWQMGKVDQGFFTFWLISHILNKPLSYIGFGGQGKQVRDILHIDDVFDLLIKQLNNLQKLNGQIYNIGGGLKNSISLLELTNLCKGLTKRSLKIKSYPKTKKWDIISYISDNKKIQKACGWQPKKNLSKTLGDIFKWINSEPQVLKHFQKII